jgi:hypothetical protein
MNKIYQNGKELTEEEFSIVVDKDGKFIKGFTLKVNGKKFHEQAEKFAEEIGGFISKKAIK